MKLTLVILLRLFNFGLFKMTFNQIHINSFTVAHAAIISATTITTTR